MKYPTISWTAFKIFFALPTVQYEISSELPRNLILSYSLDEKATSLTFTQQNNFQFSAKIIRGNSGTRNLAPFYALGFVVQDNAKNVKFLWKLFVIHAGRGGKGYYRLVKRNVIVNQQLDPTCLVCRRSSPKWLRLGIRMVPSLDQYECWVTYPKGPCIKQSQRSYGIG